jgi:hypothetical protein
MKGHHHGRTKIVTTERRKNTAKPGLRRLYLDALLELVYLGHVSRLIDHNK